MPTENHGEVSSESLPGRSEKGGAPPGNLNAASSLLYVQNIEDRVDRRTALGIGLKYHREQLLAEFPVENYEKLSTIPAERTRRLVKLRVIRELRWGRIQAAVESNDVAAFEANEAKFRDAVIAEEKAELRFIEAVKEFRDTKAPDLATYIRSRDAAAREGAE